jgi:hypothetical protein
MTNRTNLQVPMTLTMKKQAEQVAADHGFSSLQEVVRVFIANFAKGSISLGFRDNLSPHRMDLYEQDRKDTDKSIRSKSIKVHKSVKSAIEHLDNL